jgi:hypothetical protein
MGLNPSSMGPFRPVLLRDAAAMKTGFSALWPDYHSDSYSRLKVNPLWAEPLPTSRKRLTVGQNKTLG